MNEYQLIISNDHILVKVDNKVFMLDTGAPSWGNFRGTIRINNEDFYFSPGPVDFERISDFIGHHIDGYIGKEIVNRFGGILINKESMTVQFGRFDNLEGERVEYRNSKVRATINGHTVDAYVDTGAHLPMVDPSLLRGCEFINNVVEDTNFGPQTVRQMVAKITVGSKEYEGPVLEKNRTIMSYSSIALLFIGVNQFFDRTLYICPQENYILFN